MSMATACRRSHPCGPSSRKERPHILSATASPYPQHALAIGFHHYGGVAMSLLDGKFVHCDHADASQIDRAQLALQVTPVDQLHRRPSQPVVARHVLHNDIILHSRATLPASRLVTRAYGSNQLRRSNFGPHCVHATRSRGTISSTGTSKIGRSRTRRCSLSWIAAVLSPQPLHTRANPAFARSRITHQRDSTAGEGGVGASMQWLRREHGSDPRQRTAPSAGSADLRSAGGANRAAAARGVYAMRAEVGAPKLVGTVRASHQPAGGQRGAAVQDDVVVQHVARYYGLAWTTVKLIDWRHLERELGPVDLAGVSVIAMDEFAIQKGHRYATVVVEPYRKRVLWVGRGRGREDVRPFFALLGPQGCERLQAVAMDMNTAYELEVRLHCPGAQIVFDLFHVVAKYGREVIDRSEERRVGK